LGVLKGARWQIRGNIDTKTITTVVAAGGSIVRVSNLEVKLDMRLVNVVACGEQKGPVFIFRGVGQRNVSAVPNGALRVKGTAVGLGLNRFGVLA